MTTFDYNGKKAVATGAGGAIGGEIARGLARAGAQVAICASPRTHRVHTPVSSPALRCDL